MQQNVKMSIYGHQVSVNYGSLTSKYGKLCSVRSKQISYDTYT